VLRPIEPRAASIRSRAARHLAKSSLSQASRGPGMSKSVCLPMPSQPAASAENATQRSLRSWQPPRASLGQWPIAGTAHLRASATEAIRGYCGDAGCQLEFHHWPRRYRASALIHLLERSVSAIGWTAGMSQRSALPPIRRCSNVGFLCFADTAGAGRSDATCHSCKGHIAIPVAAFPLRPSRIVPCFDLSSVLLAPWPAAVAQKRRPASRQILGAPKGGTL